MKMKDYSFHFRHKYHFIVLMKETTGGKLLRNIFHRELPNYTAISQWYKVSILPWESHSFISYKIENKWFQWNKRDWSGSEKMKIHLYSENAAISKVL